MSIKDIYKVESIKSSETYDWLLNKHYAKRIPPISFSFGLFDKNKTMEGICTFGVPISSQLKKCCTNKYSNIFYELNRLCVNQNEKNMTSFFVSQCLKLLPKPLILVSYADSSQNHHGYIYQATNWIYTGLSIKINDYMVKGLEHLHGATILDSVGRNDNGIEYTKGKIERLKEKYGDKLYKKERPRKHRYFYFIGSKKQKKDMLKNLKYEIKHYPKGDNKRYDASYKPKVQTKLF
jgi:hypothetical protein